MSSITCDVLIALMAYFFVHILLHRYLRPVTSYLYMWLIISDIAMYSNTCDVITALMVDYFIHILPTCLLRLVTSQPLSWLII